MLKIIFCCRVTLHYYSLQEHVAVDLKTHSQLASSQSSVLAIFWFFYTWFGLKVTTHESMTLVWNSPLGEHDPRVE